MVMRMGTQQQLLKSVFVILWIPMAEPWMSYSPWYHQKLYIFKNKSTASGAKYARSSVIFPHRIGLCQGEVDAVKTGPR